MSSLSSWDAARIRDWEDSFQNADDPVSTDDNEVWLRADDDAEERWFQKLREGDL